MRPLHTGTLVRLRLPRECDTIQDMQKIVLVVEDEIDMREAIAAALKNAGLHVITASNGQEGVQKAVEFQPDLILMDLLMPIMDGHTALKQIRESEWGKNAKVIILTAMDDIANLGGAYDEGISGYITKSEISLADLVLKVKDTLGIAE